eukprot:1196020-Prorocentrum_minimum.AAC.13
MNHARVLLHRLATAVLGNTLVSAPKVTVKKVKRATVKKVKKARVKVTMEVEMENAPSKRRVEVEIWGGLFWCDLPPPPHPTAICGVPSVHAEPSRRKRRARIKVLEKKKKKGAYRVAELAVPLCPPPEVRERAHLKPPQQSGGTSERQGKVQANLGE